jgi:hypothetical protein
MEFVGEKTVEMAWNWESSCNDSVNSFGGENGGDKLEKRELIRPSTLLCSVPSR